MKPSHAWPLAAAALLVAGSGCEAVSWVAQGAVGSEPPPIKVPAEYDGLKDQRVAVLVDMGLATRYQHPMAQLECCEAISQRLAAKVPDAKVVDARQVVEFQRRNIYWSSVPNAKLANRLGVTRLVMVDVMEYRLHEPGNRYLWQGRISARVGVVEADGPRPNAFAYETTVRAQYPPEEPKPLVRTDVQSIRMGTLKLLARSVVGKFHEHEEARTE